MSLTKINVPLVVALATGVQAQNPTPCNNGGQTPNPTVIDDPDDNSNKCCSCDQTNCFSDPTTYAVNTAMPSTCCNQRTNAATYKNDCSITCSGNYPRLASDSMSCVAETGCGNDKPSKDGSRCCTEKTNDPKEAEYDANCDAACGDAKPLLVAATTNPTVAAKCVASCDSMDQKASQGNKRCCLKASTDIMNAEFDDTCKAVCPSDTPVRLDGTATECTACSSGQTANKPAAGGIPTKCCTDSVKNVASYNDNCEAVCPTAQFTLLSSDKMSCLEKCEAGQVIKNGDGVTSRCCDEVSGATISDTCGVTCPNASPLVSSNGKACVASCGTAETKSPDEKRCCTNIDNAATYSNDCTAATCGTGFAANTGKTKCCTAVTDAASYDADCGAVCPTGAGAKTLLQLDGKSCKANCDAGGAANTAGTKCCTVVTGAASYDANCAAACPSSGATFLAADGKSCKTACDTSSEAAVGTTRCCTKMDNVATYNTDCTAKTCSSGSTLADGKCSGSSSTGSSSAAAGLTAAFTTTALTVALSILA